VDPQVGFSVAMRTTSAAISGLVLGRPGRRVFEPSYLFATSWRYHRKKVSGVTMPAIDATRRRPTTLPFTARRRRWSSVRRRRRDGCAARRTRFSSSRYSMTACCCRLTQPAKSSQKKASGGGIGSMAQACPRDRPGFKDWIVGASIGRVLRHKPPPTTSIPSLSGNPTSAEFSHKTPRTASRQPLCRLPPTRPGRTDLRVPAQNAGTLWY
jgi:hypothetical protein